MNLRSIYFDIKEFLSIPDQNFNLEQCINYYFKSEPPENKLEILADILSFIKYFSMFRDIKPFMNSLYHYIINTIEIKNENTENFEKLLIKNILMRFMQEYIDYSKLIHKTKTLKFLSDSLEKLKVQPLIINLGLLLKPLYKNQEYLNLLPKLQEFEVQYDSSDDLEIKIKGEIDTWLKSQYINLDNQEDIRKRLEEEFNKFVSKYGIKQEEKIYNKLLIEVKEMFTMKLAILSLMEQIPEDTFEPIPIK